MKYLISILIFSFALTLGAFDYISGYKEFKNDLDKTVKVSVKAANYTQFRTTVAYDVMPSYKYGSISTFANLDESEVVVCRHASGKFDADDLTKEGAMILLMYAKKSKDGYDVYIKLESDAKSKKLAKDMEKAFKKKRK